MQTPARIDEYLAASVSRVQEAFEQAWRASPETRASPPPHGLALRRVLDGFGTHYRRLSSLPRRSRRSMQRSWKRTLNAIALLMTLGQLPAWAATLAVAPGTPPSINADGKCSLIEAIVNANLDRRAHLDCVAGSGTDTILLPSKSAQRLKAAETLPPITSRIVIEGRQSTLQRTTSRDSYLPFFRVRSTGDLTLNKMTVSGATASGVLGGTPGVHNDGGSLTLNDSILASSQTGLVNLGGQAALHRTTISGSGTTPGHDDFFGGGGIENRSGGNLVLTDSVVTGNVGAFGAGGIFNDQYSSLTILDSTVSQNVTGYEGPGGGIENHGIVTLAGTTVSGNRSEAGGGIFNTGTATLRDCTISGNRSGEYGGGGIAAAGGTLTLENCTLSGNSAPIGGAVYVLGSGALAVASSTVTGNVAPAGRGGGLFIQNGTLSIRRSIVSGNAARPGATAPEIFMYNEYSNAVILDEHNLFGHDGDAGVEGFVPGSTDIVPNEPLGAILLPLADNGGGTKTHALAIGSPALDASPDDATCPSTDQRGNPRPRGPACDIGAFEGVAVLCNGKVTTMVGTINDDRLTGTAGPDVISGLLGNDTVYGLGGNDVVCAGSGNDVLYGGAGADLLFSEPGDDRLFGQGGNDTLNGGVGKDACDGGAGTGDSATTCESVSGVP